MTSELIKHKLFFKFKAGTSRGIYTEKDLFFLLLKNDTTEAWGEIAPLHDLSVDSLDAIEKKFIEIKSKIESFEMPKSKISTAVYEFVNSLNIQNFPSLRFGIETALLDFSNGGKKIIFDNDFHRGLQKIPINGLVWMGTKDFMYEQVKSKIEEGFSCIKMKIGAIDFDEEIEILKFIRSQFSEKEIEIRLDANGAFTTQDALQKLEQLSRFHIHSIEQPIKPNQWDDMAKLCLKSPISIALDEELIGNYHKKNELLSSIKPHYIILKPTLVGGFYECEEWMKIADKHHIKYWLTSALESNIGLNAICQFTVEKKLSMPQGLGTGQLFTNNIEMPLKVERGFIFMR